MHIVVPVKSVHDPNISPALLSIGADGRTLSAPAGMPSVMNGYDANAVEEAIRLKEAGGGTVTVISVGNEDAVTHLRRAIAMGADRAVLIEGPTGLDADGFLVASLLASAIRDLPSVDLVLCGRQASDTDAGQVPAMLAEHLRMTSVGPVKALRAEGPHVIVDRIGEDNTERLRVQLPAVLAISNEINKPRVPGLKGVMAAKKAEIVRIKPDGMASAGLRLLNIRFKPQPTASVEMIAASSAAEAARLLADRLNGEGLV